MRGRELGRIWQVTLQVRDFNLRPPHTDWVFIGEAKTPEAAIKEARKAAKRGKFGEVIAVKLVKDCGARDF